MDGAVSQALANNRELRAAYFDVAKARGRLLQAGLWPNPTLEVNGSSDKPFNDERQGIFTAGYQQAFPVAGRLRFAREVGLVDVAAALAEIRNRERLLIGEVERLYVQAVAAGEAIAARREQISLNGLFVTVAQQRVAAALGSEVDVNVARIEEQRLRQEIALLEADRQMTLFALRQRLGLLPSDPLSTEDTLGGIADRLEATTRAGAAGALARRPDRRGLELAADRARGEIRLARAEAWGDPTVGVTFEADRSVDEPVGLSTDKYLGLRVAVPLPLFNRNQGRVREQQAAAQQSRAQVEALELTIRTEIATAADRASRLGKVVAGLQANLLAPAARNTELLRQGYGEGKVDLSLILTSQNQSLGLRNAGVDVRRDRVLALVDLQTTTASSPHLKTDFLQRTTTRRSTTTRTVK